MLPGIDGFETCRRLRDAGVWAPVLMLTARDAIEDRVAGLDGGADDYLTKPFSFAELLARLRALARRGSVAAPGRADRRRRCRSIPRRRQVWRGDEEIALSAKEFAILESFMRRPGEVMSRFQLLEHAWDYEYENRSNVVDVYVRYLREKIDRPFGDAVDRDGARGRLPAAPGRRRERALLIRRPLPIRLQRHARVRRRDGGRAGRHRRSALYLRFESQLDETINQGLRSRAGDVSALHPARRRRAWATPDAACSSSSGESFAQILELDGDGRRRQPRRCATGRC